MNVMSVVQWWLQLVYLGMIGISSFLLGSALADMRFCGYSIVAALLAWIIVDRLQWFQMPQWIANTLAIGVLLFAMWRFMQSEDTHGQLSAVATLLVFLQSVLGFQEKTPRQYWQLAILTFLQIVVATIYSLNFEGGLLFLAYMMFAGTFLWLTSRYDQVWKTFMLARPDRARLAGRSKGNAAAVAAPQLEFDLPMETHRALAWGAGHLFTWMLIALSFAVALFVMIPRSEATWFGPKYARPTALGSSRQMEIKAAGVISLPVEAKLRFSLSDFDSGNLIVLSEPIYLKGMSLGSLEIQNGQTSWQAPYDRIVTDSYDPLERIRDVPGMVSMNITLESTLDPLLYLPQPSFLRSSSTSEFDYCHELSAVTRGRDLYRMEVSPFRYELVIPRELLQSRSATETSLQTIAFPDYAPYVPQSKTNKNRSMDDNPMERRWLTEFPAERYPTLLSVANQVKARTGSENHLQLARNLEQYFQTAGFSYTLDFRDIRRQPQLDVVEDFVANFRKGHCELYASALVLMLRSQGIPARYVVGYYGQEYNEFGEFFTVRENFAHAWVEAYIRPEDCTSEMLRQPRIAESGAWVTLDATPYSADRLGSLGSSGQALDLARSIWQGYVLGLDDQRDTQDVVSGGLGFGLTSLGAWSDRVQQGVLQVQSRPDIQAAVIGAAIVFLVTATLLSMRLGRKKRAAKNVHGASMWRRLLANTMGLLSPKLRDWLLKDSTSYSSVQFYRRLLTILEQRGWSRPPHWTHREFASEVAERMAHLNAPREITEIVVGVVEKFQRVRFGQEPLDRQDQQQIERELELVQQFLGTVPFQGKS